MFSLLSFYPRALDSPRVNVHPRLEFFSGLKFVFDSSPVEFAAPSCSHLLSLSNFLLDRNAYVNPERIKICFSYI